MTIGSAPAGGWVVLVSIITAMAKPTARPIAHVVVPNQWYANMPISEDTKCPPIMFRGCENGAFQIPKARTQLAPKGAINHSDEVNVVSKIKVKIVRNPPSNPVAASFTLTFSGLLPWPFILLK